jgi:hypothetical protein
MAIDRERLLRVLDRAHTGPVCETFQWDTEVIPRTIAANLRKYNLVKTCDPQNPINQDDDLADRFFQAGMDTALEAGMLCIDTQRRIKFSREELVEGLAAAPAEFTLGEGNEIALFKHRGMDDSTPPVWVCPLSIARRRSVHPSAGRHRAFPGGLHRKGRLSDDRLRCDGARRVALRDDGGQVAGAGFLRALRRSCGGGMGLQCRRAS